jgi:hypothetical protein
MILLIIFKKNPDETLIDYMILLKNSLVIFKPIKTQLLHLQGILPV